MHRVIDRLVLLLAAAGLSHRELRQLAAELQDLKPSDLADAVVSLRHDALNRVAFEESRITGKRTTPALRKRHRAGPAIDGRITLLLREEAGLTVKEAAEELLASLRRERPETFQAVKPPNKEGFHRWLARLLQKVEPSELLHHATLVRNKYVGDGETDWPLLPR